MPTPPALFEFRKACMQLPNEVHQHEFPPTLPATLHVFCDGACKEPTNPLAKIAAWGCVLADPDTLTHWPLASGMLPGFLQTLLRAELMAAISACQAAVKSNRAIVVWVDNDLVYKRLSKFRKMSSMIKVNQKDADLWAQLQDAVLSLGDQFLGVMKVVSRQNPSEAADAFEHWAFAANQAADRLAEQTFARFPIIMDLWQALVS